MKSKLIPFAPLAPQDRLDLNVSVFFETNAVTLSYRIEGAIERVILLPKNSDPQALWKNTCFEFFLVSEGDHYLEWNFSPLGKSACLQFQGYRQAAKPSPDLQKTVLSCASNQSRGVYTLEAKVKLPFTINGTPKGSVTSVLELSDQTLTYWAVKHWRPKPDFHAPESFFPMGRTT